MPVSLIMIRSRGAVAPERWTIRAGLWFPARPCGSRPSDL